MTTPNGTTERRVLDVEIEYRTDDPKNPRVRGYAAVFDKPSLPMGFSGFRFTEQIAPGAFKDALATARSIPLLIEHGGLALADTETKSLTLSEDGKGLRFDALLDPADPDTQRVVPKLKRGTLRKMSFGFRLAPQGDEWNEDEKTGVMTRTIRKVAELFDVSLVQQPAYPDTAVALRSLDDWKKEHVEAPSAPIAREDRRRRLALIDQSQA